MDYKTVNYLFLILLDNIIILLFRMLFYNSLIQLLLIYFSIISLECLTYFCQKHLINYIINYWNIISNINMILNGLWFNYLILQKYYYVGILKYKII